MKTGKSPIFGRSTQSMFDVSVQGGNERIRVAGDLIG